MATLETIRTRAGVLISVIIGVALLAFIVDADTLRSATSMFSSKYDAGEIAGKSISYQDYQTRVDEVTRIAQITMGANGTLTEEMNDQIREQAWNDFIKERVLYQEFEKVGVSVSNAELTDLMSGSDPSPMVRQLFTNPQTGAFDRSMLINAIQNMDMDPNFKAYWLILEDQIRDQQILTKYSNLLNRSLVVNTLDVKAMVADMTVDVTFSCVSKSYNTYNDSTVTVSESEMKKYYNANKDDFKQTRTRDIDYVVFNIAPSADDYIETLTEMQRLQTEFATLPLSDIPQFVSFNSESPFDNKYYKQGELPLALDTFAFKESVGNVLPLYQEGNTYSMARISDERLLPDSVKIRVIALDLQNIGKKDSIVELLNNGADFAQIAAEFSADPSSSAQGGDIGWRKFNDLMRPIADSCFYLPKGRIITLDVQQGSNIFQVTERGPEVRKVQVAVVNNEVKVGKVTSQSLFAAANALSAQSQGSTDKFAELATNSGYTKSLIRSVDLGAKQIGPFANAREIVRWAYGAKKGAVSEVFEIDNKFFVVASLNEIHEDGVSPFNSVSASIESILRKQKMGDKFIAEFNEQLKSVQDLNDLATKTGAKLDVQNLPVLFTSDFVSFSLSPEYALIGAVTTVKDSKLSKPIRGESGVFVFSQNSRNEKPDATNIDIEKARFRSTLATRMYEFYPSLIEKANVKDNRGNFY